MWLVLVLRITPALLRISARRAQMDRTFLLDMRENNKLTLCFITGEFRPLVMVVWHRKQILHATFD